MSGELDETGRTTHADATGETEQAVAAPRRRRRESLRLRRAEVVYVAALAAFAILAALAYKYAYFAWDLRLARAIQSIDFPGWAAFMEWTSVFGNGLTSWGLTIPTALIFFFWRRRSEGVGVLMTVVGGSLVNRILKVLIGRPRPSAELVGFAYGSDEMSFPSGHVTFYVCFFGFLFFAAYALLPRATLVRRVALVLLPLPVLFIGLSRITLRAHWPSDVLGAYLLSGVWLTFSLDIYRRWKRRATFHPEEPVVAAE